MRCLSVVFGAIGGILLLIAASLHIREQNFLMHAERTLGTVVSLDRRLSEDGHTYCPVFKFNTQGGGTASYTANVCADPPSYQVGF